MSKFLDEAGLRQLIELIRNLNSEGESELPDITPADAGKVLMVNSEGKWEVVDISRPDPIHVLYLKQTGEDPTTHRPIVNLFIDYNDHSDPLSYSDVQHIVNDDMNLPLVVKDIDNYTGPSNTATVVLTFSYMGEVNDGGTIQYTVALLSPTGNGNMMLISSTPTSPLKLSLIG